MTAEHSNGTKHHYRVKVGGYVFPQLPEGTPAEKVRERVVEMVDEGELDVTEVTVESEFDD